MFVSTRQVQSQGLWCSSWNTGLGKLQVAFQGHPELLGYRPEDHHPPCHCFTSSFSWLRLIQHLLKLNHHRRWPEPQTPTWGHRFSCCALSFSRATQQLKRALCGYSIQTSIRMPILRSYIKNNKINNASPLALPVSLLHPAPSPRPFCVAKASAAFHAPSRAAHRGDTPDFVQL